MKSLMMNWNEKLKRCQNPERNFTPSFGFTLSLSFSFSPPLPWKLGFLFPSAFGSKKAASTQLLGWYHFLSSQTKRITDDVWISILSIRRRMDFAQFGFDFHVHPCVNMSALVFFCFVLFLEEGVTYHNQGCWNFQRKGVGLTSNKTIY